MKKRLFALLFIFVLAVTALTSCFVNQNKPGTDPETPENPSGEDKENLIFNATSELYIISAAGVDPDKIRDFASELMSQRIEAIKFDSPDSEAHTHEIVFGNTSRPISQMAMDRLKRIDKNTDDERVCLVYSNGSSIAVVWEEDEDNIMRDIAFDYLYENLITNEFVSPSKTLYSEKIDLYEYYTEKDTAYKTPLWAEFEKTYGKELADAYKQLYSIYSESCIVWLANLYDPDICVCVDLYGEEECSGTKYCGTGGWYYSNSARDTMGYLPDAESTNQALNFLTSAGLAYDRNYDYINVITEEMKQQIGDFIYALEEPNGYFYHPQWGIAFTDTKISRRARDLSWCCNILSKLGRTPKYTTASGMKGEDVLGTSAPLAGRLGASCAAAVSKVVLINNDSYAPHLQDLDAFKAYLASLDLYNRSYSVGNELTAQTPQITERDKQIGTPEDPTPLMDCLIEWLNAGQNPETGNWDWKKPGDAGYQDYYGTNGLLKISGIYETHGVVMPHTREAVLSATADISNPAQIGAVVDLYNTWFAIENLIGNLRKNGGESGEAEADEIVAELRSIAPDAVKVSREKIVDFLKPDGSASYGREYSSSTSQGCPAAVPNSVEGDVNGSTIAINGIIGHSLEALEIDKIPMLGEAARYLFRKEIANLSPISKVDNSVTPDELDFEYNEIGEEPEDLEINHNGGSGTANVIADPTGAGKGNVVEIISEFGCGDSIRVPVQNASSLASTYIFEGDFYIDAVSSDYPLQITLGGCYMFTVREKNGQLQLWESSSGTGTASVDEYLGVTLERDTWFRVRAEYYCGDHDTVRIKFYCDTDLSDGTDMKLYAVTDNYYDVYGEKLSGEGKPSTSFTSTNIYVMSSTSAVIYIDNVNCYRSKLGYSEVIDPNDQPYTNIDPPSKDRVTYDFEDGSIPEDIVKTGNVMVDENNRLALNGSANASSVKVPMTIREKGAKCGYVSFKLNCTSANAGDQIMTFTAMDDTLKVFSFKVLAADDENGKYLTLQPKGEFEGKVMEDLRMPLGEDVLVEFEYYHDEDVVIVYIDGEFAGASTYIYVNANKYTMDSFVVETVANKSCLVTLDDIIVEKKSAEFEDAVAPNIPEKVYDFSSENKDVTVSGTGTGISGGALNMNITTSLKNSVSVPVNKRANIANYVFAELDISFVKTAASGTTHTLKLTDKDGNTILAFELVANGNKVELYEVGKGGRVTSPIFTYDDPASIKIKLEMFFDQKMVHIYDGSAVIAKSSIILGAELIDNGFAGLTVESGSAKTNVKIDNIRFETLYAIYKTVNVNGAVNPEKDLSEGLTFESSNSGSIPASIAAKLFNSNYVAIQNMMNDVIGKFSNVFAFVKDSSGNDEISIGTGKTNASASCSVFETDIRCDLSSNDHVYRLYFGESGRSNTAYFLYIKNVSGKIVLSDISAASGESRSNDFATGISNGEWFNLRVEFYKGTKDTVRIKIFVNDKCIAVSNNFAGSHQSSATPMAGFSNVTFYCMGAARGTVYLDNVSISSSDATCTDQVTTKK